MTTRRDDRSSRGWTSSIVTEMRNTYFTAPVGAQVVTPREKAERQQQLTAQGGLPPIPILNPNQQRNVSEFGNAATMNNSPRPNLVMPQDREIMQEYLQDPTGFARVNAPEGKSILDSGKDMLSRLFDTEDEKETVVESVWDGTLKGLGWLYDRMNQAATFGYSITPGGIESLSWGEADQVSIGQALVTGGARDIRAAQKGELWRIPGAGLAGVLGGYIGVAENAPFTQENFNILDAEQRRLAFEEDALGKWASGSADFLFAVFADPFIIGGKALKITRLKWVDRPLRTDGEYNRFIGEVTTDVARLKSGEAPKTGVGQFLDFALDDATTVEQLLQHPVVKANANRDTFTKALVAARLIDDKFEAGGLVMQAVAGSPGARNQLATRMPSLADEIGQAQRALTDARMAFSPDSLRQVQKEFRESFTRRSESFIELNRAFVLGREGVTKAQVDEAFRLQQQAQRNLDDAMNYTSRDPIANPITQQEIDKLTQIRNELFDRDVFYRNAFDDQITGSLIGSNKGFGRGALGKAVEARRQQKATVSASLLDTPNPWKVDTLYGVGRTSRVVNIWRWAGFEKPQGLITLRGLSNTEQSREMSAVVNNVRQYKGADKFVTVDGEQVLIGGARRKQELLEQYIQATGSGVTDQNALALVVDKIEQAILTDIGLANGLTPTEVQALLSKHSFERQRLLGQLADEKQQFFVDRKPAADGSYIDEIVHVPYVESQLKDSTVIMNFREAEKLAASYSKMVQAGKARHFDDADLLQTLRDGGEITVSAASWSADQLQSFYNAFNNLWRPGVLLRLGYLQRNAAEGIFRSAAFSSSLSPLGDAAKQVGYGARNAAVKRAVNRSIRKAKKKGIETGQYQISNSRRFRKWRAMQEQAYDVEIASIRATIDDMTAKKAQLSPESSGWATIDENIKYHQKVLDETTDLAKQFMEDDVAALSVYRKQGNAKRRVGDGTTTGPDGMVEMNAYGNPDMNPSVLRNLSADVATKTRLSLADSASRNFFRAIDEQFYVEVRPDQGMRYFEGVATTIRHLRSSQLGQRVMRAQNQDDLRKIARDLYDGDLKEVAEFITGTNKQFTRAGGGRVGFDSYKDAEDYVGLILQRINQVAPNPELKKLAAVADVEPADVARLLDTDEYRGMLAPVIGNDAKLVGNKKFVELYRDTVNTLFKVIGTIPEDSLVRVPFYARRFAETRDVAMRRLLNEYGDRAFIPIKEINAAYGMAHRRALRDTKEFLYTIERRTNLGHYAEFLFPFISAAQNSVTALGKLAWRDPALPAIMVAIWRAPDRAEITDDQGRIVIPLPENMVPDIVKKQFGLENMRNMKFSKEQFNVIFPESGYAFLPRFGPMVGVPAEWMMRYNWFGQSLETPDWLSNVFGDDAAKEIWDNYRDYILGEDRGVSAQPLSWDKILPPAAQKIVQLYQGMDSGAYVSAYNKNYQSEMAKLKAGYRDTIPTAEELTELTNGLFRVRFLANLLAFTPPQYESVIDPLVDMQRLYDRAYPEDSQRMINEKFGNILLMAGETSTSKNVAGAGATLDSVRRARKYEGLLQKISPYVQDNLNVLGIILNGDPDAEYDPSALAWQASTKIPGINRTFRELQTPEQAALESSRAAGWVAYIQFMDQLTALMENAGITSIRRKEAAPYAAQRDAFIEAAKNNPLYRGWYDDYVNFGSSRTLNAVEVLREALSDETFMRDNAENPVWQSAYIYMTAREDIIRDLKDIDSRGFAEKDRREFKKQRLEDWTLIRAKLAKESPRWATVQNRYLNGDDDPMEPGVQVSIYQTTTAPMVIDETDTLVDSAGYLRYNDEFEEF